MTLSDFVFVLEILGTISFAISGVMVAREQHLDVFGAVVLGCTCAVGGGVVRDLILGITPPAMFRKPIYVTVAAIVSLLDFALLRAHRDRVHQSARIDQILNITDTIGLAAFVAVGTRTAYEQGFGDNLFLCVFVGCLTGIGGGILRDIMAGQTPLILRRHVYGLAAIIGALSYGVMIEVGAGYIIASIASMAITCLIRYLAIRYRWNLPAFW